MSERRISFSLVPESPRAGGRTREPKHSFTSAATSMATTVSSLAAPKTPTTSTDTSALPPSRKPSFTSAAIVATLASGGVTPVPSRERKPSLSSIAISAVPAGTSTPASPSNRKSNNNERKTTLTTVGIAAIAVGSSSRNLLGAPTSPSTLAVGKKQAQHQQRVEMRTTRQSFSSAVMDAHRIEIFFHVPTYKELQRLRVLRTLTLIGLQALVQREFGVPFEDQRIYWHGDLLEGDEDLTFYDVHDQSVLNVRVQKRYRTIGDVFTKIKTVQFRSHQLAKPDDYDIIEVVAPLPPTNVVFKRLVTIITYLQRLDVLQSQRTNRRVWKQCVSFWEEPAASNPVGGRRRSSLRPLVPIHAKSNRSPSLQSSSSNGDRVEDETRVTAVPPAFVKLHSGPERVSYVVSLAQTHSIAQRLQLPPDQRTPNDLRHIKKWLSNIKFFASATLPEAAVHEIARACAYARFTAGDFIFRQGDVGDHFYIVISGCVSLAAYGNGFFATMTPGQCFGEISLSASNSGLRTASATVNFAAPIAELALLSGDIYRRVINPHKKAVLQTTEKAIYSIPQLRSLPDNIVTHIAYASKKLDARHGRMLIRRGEDMNVLVLLIKGDVKVSASSSQSSCAFPVVSVVRAPAVFCQEAVLTNTPSPAPWDIEVIDSCTLLCLRVDTISIFLSPRHEIIRALNREHTHRLQDFERRFAQFAPIPQATNDEERTEKAATTAPNHRRSAAKLSRKATYMRLLASRLFESQRSILTDSELRMRTRRGAAAYVEFPKILLRHAPENDQRDEDCREQESATEIIAKDRSAAQVGSPSCAELQDEFLHRALPFGEILELREQIQFCSFAALELEDQDHRGRTRVLLRGLRQQPVEEVELVPTSDPDGIHFRFTPRPPTSPTDSSSAPGRAPQALRRSLQTR